MAVIFRKPSGNVVYIKRGGVLMTVLLKFSSFTLLEQNKISEYVALFSTGTESTASQKNPAQPMTTTISCMQNTNIQHKQNE